MGWKDWAWMALVAWLLVSAARGAWRLGVEAAAASRRWRDRRYERSERAGRSWRGRPVLGELEARELALLARNGDEAGVLEALSKADPDPRDALAALRQAASSGSLGCVQALLETLEPNAPVIAWMRRRGAKSPLALAAEAGSAERAEALAPRFADEASAVEALWIFAREGSEAGVRAMGPWAGLGGRAKGEKAQARAREAGAEALRLAAEAGSEPAARALVELGVSGRGLDEALGWAALAEDDRCARMLLGAGAKSSDSALCGAAKRGHSDLVRALIEAKKSWLVSGSSALQEAAEGGSIECVRLILPLADADRDQGVVAAAIRGGSMECLRELMKTRDPRANEGEALQEAARRESAEALREVLPYFGPGYGARRALDGALALGALESARLLWPLAQEGASENERQMWMTAAASRQSADFLKEVIPWLSERDQRAAAPYALWSAGREGAPECAALLLEQGWQEALDGAEAAAKAAREVGREDQALFIESAARAARERLALAESALKGRSAGAGEARRI